MFKKLFSKNRNPITTTLPLNTQFVGRGITPLTGMLDLPNTVTAVTTTNIWVGSTSGFHHNYEGKVNVAPLRHFMKKWFPFVIDVLEVNVDLGVKMYNPNTFESHSKNGFRIHLLISPIHFAETFSNSGLDSKLKKKMNEKLVPLLKCMYEEFGGQEPTYLFFPQKTETILEYL